MTEKNKTTLDILNEIRNLRNEELTEQKDNRVFYTTVIALQKGNTGRQIYRIMEEFSIGENQSLVRELFYVYKDKPELIAVIDPERYNGIHEPEGKEINTEEEKEEWEILVKDIEEGRAKAEEKIKNQAMKLGISEKEVEGLSEIDVDKKIFARINEINKQNNKDKIYENSKNKEAKEVPFKLTQQNAKRLGIVGMNSMPLNQKVGVHGESLKGELGLEGKEEYADVDAIEVIPAYKLATLGIKVPNTPFIPVAKHRDGSIEAFPENVCKIYKGENNKVTKIDGQKDEATNEKPSTIMQFEGKNTSLAIKQTSPYGIVEASLAYNTKGNDGRVALTLQDKYDGTDQTDAEARRIVDSHQGKENYRKVIKEGEKHPEGEKFEREDADGDINTAKHLHLNSIVSFEGMQANFSALAMAMGGCENEQEISDLLEKTNVNLTGNSTNVEQAIKIAIDEMTSEIISQSKEPEKVKEVMQSENIKNPRPVIKALEETEWQVEETKEALGKYKGEQD